MLVNRRRAEVYHSRSLYGRTDGRTDSPTPHNGIGRATTASQALVARQKVNYLTESSWAGLTRSTRHVINWPFYFLDQFFTDTFAESYIRTETKDQPKSEIVFRLDSAISLSKIAETKLRIERSLNPTLINSRLILHAEDRLIVRD